MPAYIRTLRQVTRTLLALAWTGACYVVWLPGALLTWRAPRAARRWHALATRSWTGGLLAIFRIRRRPAGPIPPRPFFLVANHLSWVDILVLGAELGPVFVSKHELAGWPMLGHLARVTGTIFIDRGRRRDAHRVLAEIDRAIAEGASVVVFPEATSSRGDGIQPLKPALLEWAVQRAHPVHAVALRYATVDPARPAEEVVCWWGTRSFGDHALGVLAEPRIDAHLTFGATPAIGPSRQALAERLHAQLSTLYAETDGR